MSFLNKIFGQKNKTNNERSSGQTLAKEYKKKLDDDVFAILKDKGFKKVGMNFNCKQNDLIYFIQIQSSQSSTAAVCKLTVNIGIVSLKLCELMGISKPGYLNSHWRKRIGSYLDHPTDKWWTIADMATADNSTNEITALLKNRVLPDMFSFKTTFDLEQFWLSGRCQGITEYERKNFLKSLEH